MINCNFYQVPPPKLSSICASSLQQLIQQPKVPRTNELILQRQKTIQSSHAKGKRLVPRQRASRVSRHAKAKGKASAPRVKPFTPANAGQTCEPLPDPKDPTTLVAICDGGAIRNGSMHCKAAFACVFPHKQDWNVAKKLASNTKHTSNRAHFMAALVAMDIANTIDPSQIQPLYLFTPSELLILSMTEWSRVWAQNNWKKVNGKPVKNKDLLEQLHANQGLRTVIWGHTNAHRKEWQGIWNAKADRLAKAAHRKE